MSATTSIPLTGEANNTDYLITMAPVKEWIYEPASEQSVLEVGVLEAEKMGKCKYLSKGQIVMARLLG